MPMTPSIAVVSPQRERELPAKAPFRRLIAIAIAMWITTLGVDFFFNAGVLAKFYMNAGTVFLPPAQLFRRIPFGYASFLLAIALMLWVQWRLDIRGLRAGGTFGAIWGAVMGLAGGLGMYSVLPLGLDFLAGVAVCQTVQNAVAGALGGAGLSGTRAGKLYGAAFAILLAGLVGAIALQQFGFASVHRR